MTVSEVDVAKVAEAATAVMAALQGLTQEERERVIQSTAALFGVAAYSAEPQQAQGGGAKAHRNEGATNPGSGGGKKVSLVEFIKEKQPSTNPQKIACFAYYREHYEGEEHFSSSDLSGYFAKAKLPAPGPNYKRDYNNAVKAAWIHDDGDQSYLTQEGERAVDSAFEGLGSRRGGSVAGKKRKKAGKKE